MAELYNTRVILNVRLVRIGEVPERGPIGEPIEHSWFGGRRHGLGPLSGLVVTDDVDTVYTSHGSGGGGSEAEATFHVQLIPGAPPAATELRIDWGGSHVAIALGAE